MSDVETGVPPESPPASTIGTAESKRTNRAKRAHRAGSDLPFLALMGALGGGYLLLILALLAADIAYTSPAHFVAALSKPEIRFAVRLTLISCTISALLSIWVATPLGYLLSRFQFRGRWLIDTALDVPVVLPPLVIGLSLLILFHLPIAGGKLDDWFQQTLGFRVTFRQPAVILAQFAVACAFAVQTMRVTFDQIDPRAEQVALTLGCRRSQAFLQVVLPQAWRGLIAAFTIAWARSLGEFGPILVFAGATRMRTEVLSTTVFLELSVGRLEAAVAVSLMMVMAAMAVLGIVRLLGARVN
ncbi:MAG TPA: ABC transporter permease [Pirellulales bacterium]|nr:ABC transporter permease [Pirellulales bacterium]